MKPVISASAPGSLMLFGEHAVLHGHPAIVTAVSYRVSASAAAYERGRALIRSSLGEREMALDAVNASPPFEFVGAVIQTYADALGDGLKLEISADMPPDIGFGTSAAVSVACSAAIRGLLNRPIESGSLHRQCLDCVRRVQGSGSGADVAASVYGGMLIYSVDTFSVEVLNNHAPLAVAYSGSKEKTPDVVAKVDLLREAQPGLVDALYGVAGDLSMQAADAIRERDWKLLGQCLNAGQEVMESLGVSNAHLESMIAELRNDSGIHGAKISGAGLGDCVVGVGRPAGAAFSFDLLPAEVEERGVAIESD